jgi:hypothetical protein
MFYRVFATNSKLLGAKGDVQCHSIRSTFDGGYASATEAQLAVETNPTLT